MAEPKVVRRPAVVLGVSSSLAVVLVAVLLPAVAAMARPAGAPAPSTPVTELPPVAGNHTSAGGRASVPVAPTAPSAAPAVDAGLAIAQSHCRPSAATAADLQDEFDRRGPVWGGGDGAEPVPIDGGRTLWLFGDTFIGGGPKGGPLTTTNMVHNSLVVQYGGSCFLTLLDQQGPNWGSAIPDPVPGYWYWPNAGTYDPGTGVLSITATLVHQTDPNSPWGWELVGVDVLRYRLQPTITRTDVERLFTYGSGDVAQFGTNLLTSGGSTYFYGCTQTQPPVACYAARTDAQVHVSTLQYKTASGWSVHVSDAVPMSMTGLSGTQLHVTAAAGGFVASNELAILSSQTNAWWGPTPTGPFRLVGDVFDAQDPPIGPLHSNWFVYGGRAISTSAGLIGVVNVNTWDHEAEHVAGVYGPRFVPIDPQRFDRAPFGHLDPPIVTQDGSRVRGWAIDPDTADPVVVALTIDGVPGPTVTADDPWSGLDAEHPGSGDDHGFDLLLPVPPGTHDVCVTAHNLSYGGHDGGVGCVQASEAGPDSSFVPVTPVRILDSRDGTGGFISAWNPGQTRSLKVAGLNGVPVGATAVVINLTVAASTSVGFVTVSPTGGVVPNASNIDFAAGQTIANLATVPVGSGGFIDLYNQLGRTHLVADLVGYYTQGTGSAFASLTPARILDSRTGTGGFTTPWSPGQVRSLPVAGVGGVPADATAVVVNLTAVNASTGTFLTAWPSGLTRPMTSSLNVHDSGPVANLVIVGVGPNGAIDLYNKLGTVNLVVDVVGAFRPSGSPGAVFVPLSPTRLLDSRVGTGGFTSPWGPGQSRTLHVAGTLGIPAGATAVVFNLTSADATAGSYVTAWPTGVGRPISSNLNFPGSFPVANLVTVQVGSGGGVDLYNRLGSVDLIADVVGYYTAP